MAKVNHDIESHNYDLVCRTEYFLISHSTFCHIDLVIILTFHLIIKT